MITPEHTRVVMTAAKPFDRDSAQERNLAAVGITPPEEHNGGHE